MKLVSKFILIYVIFQSTAVVDQMIYFHYKWNVINNKKENCKAFIKTVVAFKTPVIALIIISGCMIYFPRDMFYYMYI